MIQIVPKDSHYIPLTQQKWCCVPTCIQMVMIRHKIPLQPAELIGYHMGLIVPKEAKKFFWSARTGPRPPAGYGTQGNQAQYGPNKVFKKLKISLKMTWTLINKFKTINQFRHYLSQATAGKKDILVCYDWPSLFDPKEKDHWGHVCVLDKIYLKEDKIRIIDPDWEAPKWRKVTIPVLYKSMVIHGSKNSADFWELSLQ